MKMTEISRGGSCPTPHTTSKITRIDHGQQEETGDRRSGDGVICMCKY